MIDSLANLHAEIERLAAVTGAPAGLLPSSGTTRDHGHPHVEVDARGYHYVVVERGEELERFTTHSPDEFYFRVFRDVTFAQACAFELRHRIAGQDSRRVMFERQLWLLAKLSPAWKEQREAEISEILRQYPYSDGED